MKSSIETHIESHPDPEAREALLAAFIKLRGSVFKNRIEVFKHLQQRGYKISRSKLYKDADDGVLVVQEDKTIFQSDVERYVADSRIQFKEDSDQAEASEHFKKVKEAELEGQRLQNRKRELEVQKLEGELVSKREAETQAAVNLATYEAEMRHLVRTRVEDWLNFAKGNPQAMVDIINAEIDDMGNDLAKRGDIRVEVRADAVAAA